MSKVLAEAPASPADTTVESPASDTIASFESRVEGLSATARARWELTGDLEAAEALDPAKTSDDSPGSSPEDNEPGADSAQTETASGPDKHEPPPDGQEPKTGSRQERNWKQLRQEREQVERDNIALKAKLEVYERERAGSGTSAPATDKDKPAASERPKRPRLSDFETVEAYETAMDTFEDKRDEYNAQLLEDRRREDTLRSSTRERIDSFTAQITHAKTKYKDFEAVAFNPDVPASFTSIPILQRRKDGAEIAYYLGKHVEEAQRIAELTAIRGVTTPEAYQAFVHQAQTDPQAAATLARAEALAEAALDRVSETLAKPAASPLKRPAPKPTSEVRVNPQGSPVVTDEEADAIERGDQDAYERIANKRDVERRQRGF